MPAIANLIRDTSTTTGTGTITVSGTPPSGYLAWGGSSGYSVGDVVSYAVKHQSANESEVGKGVLVTSTTISRTAADVESGTSGPGVLVNFSAGTKDVYAVESANTVKISTRLRAMQPRMFV